MIDVDHEYFDVEFGYKNSSRNIVSGYNDARSKPREFGVILEDEAIGLSADCWCEIQ